MQSKTHGYPSKARSQVLTGNGGGGGLLCFLLSPPSPLLYVVQLSNAHSVLEEGRERGMREVSQQGRRRKVLQ